MSNGYYDIDDHMNDLYTATHNGQSLNEGLAMGTIDAMQFRDVTVDINQHIRNVVIELDPSIDDEYDD